MQSFFAVDLRDALRSLRANPIVTFVAIVSLALGIGANAALFSILNSLLFKTLPVRDPAEPRRHRRRVVDQSDLGADPRAAAGALRGRVCLVGRAVQPVVQRRDRFRGPAPGRAAACSTCSVLRAALGRTFTEADDVRGGGPDGPVAVVSHSFWQRRMGGAPDAIGRHLTVDGIDVTVIGVAPRGFFGPDVGRSADIIVPLGAITAAPGQARMLDGRSTWWLEIMARLKPGQTIEDGRGEAERHPATDPRGHASAGLAREGTRAVPDRTAEARLGGDRRIEPARELPASAADRPGRRRRRAGDRLREPGEPAARAGRVEAARDSACRLALGASRFRLAKQLLAETAMLAAVGAGLGLLVAKWGSALLVRQLGGVTLDLSMDWRVVLFTTGDRLRDGPVLRHRPGARRQRHLRQ